MSVQDPYWLSQGVQLDKASSVPFYQQLKDLLLEAVRDETLQTGDRLPSERQLSEHLGISRLTVRRTLGDLVNAGRLVTQPGKGTYIRGPKLEQGTRQLAGLTEDLRRRGHTVTSRVLRVLVQPASGKTAKLMRLGPEDEVVLLERLRLVDGVPLSIERSYLNHRLCPGIVLRDLAASLYHILQETHGLKIPKAEQTYEAVGAGRKESALLGVTEGSPLLLCERIAYTDNGDVIEYGVAWFRGDRYKFHTILLGSDPGLNALTSDVTT